MVITNLINIAYIQNGKLKALTFAFVFLVLQIKLSLHVLFLFFRPITIQKSKNILKSQYLRIQTMDPRSLTPRTLKEFGLFQSPGPKRNDLVSNGFIVCYNNSWKNKNNETVCVWGGGGLHGEKSRTVSRTMSIRQYEI